MLATIITLIQNSKLLFVKRTLDPGTLEVNTLQQPSKNSAIPNDTSEMRPETLIGNASYVCNDASASDYRLPKETHVVNTPNQSIPVVIPANQSSAKEEVADLSRRRKLSVSCESEIDDPEPIKEAGIA